MNNLSAFYEANAVKDEVLKVAISNRFLDENKKPILWELEAINGEREAEIRKSCTIRVKGKNGVTTSTLDSDKFTLQLACETVKFPNLNDAALQDSYGVKGADSLLKKMLKSGEIYTLMDSVNDVNGLNRDFANEVDEIKN